MTISANYEPIEYIGNGVARNFVPPFKFFDNEIVVTINGNINKNINNILNLFFIN